MPRDASECHRMPPNAPGCLRMSRDASKCLGMPPNVPGYLHMYSTGWSALEYFLFFYAVGCNATIVTVTGAPLPSETFDPCLLYVPETRTTVALTTSLMSSSPVVLRSTAVVKSPSISTTTVASSSISGEEGPVETSSVRIMIVETSSQLISPSVGEYIIQWLKVPSNGLVRSIQFRTVKL